MLDFIRPCIETITKNILKALKQAKDVGRKTVPTGYSIQQLKLICDSFDKELWEVNMYYYTN
jgi:hypothetical protein